MEPKISAHVTRADDYLKTTIRCNGFIIGSFTTNDIDINPTTKGWDISSITASSSDVFFVDELFIAGTLRNHDEGRICLSSEDLL